MCSVEEACLLGPEVALSAANDSRTAQARDLSRWATGATVFGAALFVALCAVGLGMRGKDRGADYYRARNLKEVCLAVLVQRGETLDSNRRFESVCRK